MPYSKSCKCRCMMLRIFFPALLSMVREAASFYINAISHWHRARGRCTRRTAVCEKCSLPKYRNVMYTKFGATNGRGAIVFTVQSVCDCFRRTAYYLRAMEICRRWRFCIITVVFLRESFAFRVSFVGEFWMWKDKPNIYLLEFQLLVVKLSLISTCLHSISIL